MKTHFLFYKIFRFHDEGLYSKEQNDYHLLKNNLGIPPGSDFGFSLLDSDLNPVDNIQTVRSQGSNLEVFADQIPIQYMTEEGLISSGWLDIRVW